MKRKKLLYFLIPICAIFVSLAVLFVYTAVIYSPAYLMRVITHIDSDVNDYKYFPYRKISASDKPYQYEYELSLSVSEFEIEYQKGKKSIKTTLDSFIESTDTTSFIIIRNDKVIFEKYANGYNSSSTNTSFSMSKSVVSLLIFKAIEEGYIKSINDPISDYIIEFKDLDIGNITISELLSMRSGITYDESKLLWFGDDSLTYWYPDLRKLALGHTSIIGYKL